MSRRVGVAAVAVAALALAGWWLDVARYLEPARLRALVASSGPLGPLVFIAAFAAGVFLHLPGMALVALGGLIFEAPQAFLYGWAAIVVSTATTFLLVRWFFREAFQGTLASRFQFLRRLDDRLVARGFVTVLVLRLLFFLSPPLNFALGATRVRFAAYLGGTALGVVPGVGLGIAFADGIAEIGAGGHALTPGRAAVVVALLAALAGAGWLARRHLGGGPPRPAGPEA